MASSPTLGGRDKNVPATPIYEPLTSGASDAQTRSPRSDRLLTGALAGAATWFLLDRLGVPHIFGMSGDAGIVPFTVLSAAVGLTRFRRFPVWTAIALFIFAIVIGFTGVMVGAARSYIRSDPLPKSADAIVVLSAGITADGYFTQQSMDRMISASELVRAGIAPVLIVTREQRKIQGAMISAAADQARIAALAGISQLITTGPVRNTRGEALEVARIARSRGWSSIVLVTSPFHTRRACRTFETVGLKVTCVPSDSRDIAIRRLAFPHDRLKAFGMWLYEAAGTIRYRQLGWI